MFYPVLYLWPVYLYLGYLLWEKFQCRFVRSLRCQCELCKNR